MANVSKINFNGEALDIKDTHAREQILHLTADNYTADVTGDYTVNAGDIAMSSANATMHTTVDRTIDTDGNDSVHIDGASTLNVGGLRTETFAGDKTETVTGTRTEKIGSASTTVTGKWSVNLPGKSFDMKDVALESDVNAVQTNLNNEITRAKAAETAITTSLGGRAILTFGDSYDTPVDGLNGWSAALAILLSASQHYKYGKSGMGFVPTTNKFETELDRAISEIPENERSTVKYIIVGGGANDLTATYSDVEATIKSFVIKAKASFTNAEIYISFIGNGINTKITDPAWINRMTPYNIYLMENFYRKSALDAGANISEAYYWANNDTFNDDFIHPNKNGKYNIAKAIYAGITGHVFFQDGAAYLKNNPTIKPFFSHRNTTVLADFGKYDMNVNITFDGDPKTDYQLDSIVFPMLTLTMLTPSATLYCNCTLNNTYYGITAYMYLTQGTLTAKMGLVVDHNFVTGALTVIRAGGPLIGNI